MTPGQFSLQNSILLQNIPLFLQHPLSDKVGGGTGGPPPPPHPHKGPKTHWGGHKGRPSAWPPPPRGFEANEPPKRTSPQGWGSGWGVSALEPFAPLCRGGVAAQDFPLVSLHQLAESRLSPPGAPPPPRLWETMRGGSGVPPPKLGVWGQYKMGNTGRFTPR